MEIENFETLKKFWIDDVIFSGLPMDFFLDRPLKFFLLEQAFFSGLTMHYFWIDDEIFSGLAMKFFLDRPSNFFLDRPWYFFWIDHEIFLDRPWNFFWIDQVIFFLINHRKFSGSTMDNFMDRL